MGRVGRHVSIEHAFWVDSFGWQRIAEISFVKLSTFCGVLMMTELMKWAALVLRFYLNLRGGSNVSFGSACESVLSLSCVMHGMVGPVGGNDCTPSEVHCISLAAHPWKYITVPWIGHPRKLLATGRALAGRDVVAGPRRVFLARPHMAGSLALTTGHESLRGFDLQASLLEP